MAAPTSSSGDEVFGNLALFEEFSTTVKSCKHRQIEKDVVLDNEKEILETKIAQLQEENHRLKSWMKVCIKAKGYKVSDGKQDGPIAQVLYMNHDSVCKYRHEVENFFEQMCVRSLYQQAAAANGRAKSDDGMPLPQRASMVLTENPDPATREAFTATGNVQYYLTFCMDSIGRPLVDGNAQLTEGWEIPPYPSLFREPLPVDDKPSRPSFGNRRKACCFNCGNEKHSLRDCPLPRDLVKISQNKQLFMGQGGSPAQTISGRRYHKEGEGGKPGEVADRFKNFKAGVVSDALSQALGISSRQLPPYIYGMRRMGYPPGHLLDAQVLKCDLKVYNIKDTDEEGELNSDVDDEDRKQPRYNLKKIVDFPGFNVDTEEAVRDDWQRYNSMPMQNNQRKEVMKLHLKPFEAEEMTTPLNKRKSQDFHNGGSSSKKRRFDQEQAVDMDISTDDNYAGTPVRGWFQPPLPPTPEMATPPPLPPGPAPPTPVRDSPSSFSLDDSLPWRSENNSRQTSRTQSQQNSQSSSRSASPDLDRLMSERTKLLAALDHGEDTQASSSDATPSGVDTAEEDAEEAMQDVSKASSNGVRSKDPPGQSTAGDEGDVDSSAQIGNRKTIQEGENEDSERTNDDNPDVSSKDSPDSPEPDSKPSLDSSQLSTLDVTEGDSSVFASQEMDDEEETPNKSGVPHRRKFSVNIAPHDFDPEEPAKKGIFKRLLGILKREKQS